MPNFQRIKPGLTKPSGQKPFKFKNGALIRPFKKVERIKLKKWKKIFNLRNFPVP